jgi:hypothetical protein
MMAVRVRRPSPLASETEGHHDGWPHPGEPSCSLSEPDSESGRGHESLAFGFSG